MGVALRTSRCLRVPATFRRGMAFRSPTGIATATSICSSSAGGAVPGDKSYNVLFRNPGHGRHWLKVKLVGTKTNRSALGARIRVDLKGPDGTPRSIYRTIGNNSSFGGNTLVESIGLQDARSVDRLTITWPTSQTTQTFPRCCRRPVHRDHGRVPTHSRSSSNQRANHLRIPQPTECVLQSLEDWFTCTSILRHWCCIDRDQRTGVLFIVTPAARRDGPVAGYHAAPGTTCVSLAGVAFSVRAGRNRRSGPPRRRGAASACLIMTAMAGLICSSHKGARLLPGQGSRQPLRRCPAQESGRWPI